MRLIGRKRIIQIEIEEDRFYQIYNVFRTIRNRQINNDSIIFDKDFIAKISEELEKLLEAIDQIDT